MNLQTSQFVRNTISSTLTNAFSSTNLSTQLQALRRYRARLLDNGQAMNIFLSGWSTDAGCFMDEVIDGHSVVELQDSSKRWRYRGKWCSYDTGNLMIQAIQDLCSIIDPEDPNSATIVDADGRSYKIKLGSWNYAEHGVAATIRAIVCFNNDTGENRWEHEWPLIGSAGNHGDSSTWVLNTIPSLDWNNEQTSGCVVTLSAWLRSLAIFSTINTITEKTSGILTSGKASINNLYSELSSFISSSSSSVRAWANTIISVFNQGGFTGLVNYILRAVKLVRDNLTNDNGILAFTDNKSLVPKEFIGSLIATVATTVGGILVAFAGVAGKIIGTVFAVGGYIANVIIKSLYSTYNSETLAGLVDYDNDDGAIVLPESPHGVFQLEIGPNDIINEFLTNVAGICEVQVPGGYIHFGRGALSTNAIRAEFHPTPFWTFADFDCDFYAHLFTGSTYNTYAAIINSGISSSIVMSKWLGGFQTTDDFSLTHNYSDKGAAVVDTDTDKMIRKIITRNIGLFFLWVNALTYEARAQSGPMVYSYNPLLRRGLTFGNPGEGPGVYNTHGQIAFVAYALVPFSATTITCRHSNSSQTSTINVSVPSWQNIASMCANCAADDHFNHYLKSASAIFTVTADYDSSGNYVINTFGQDSTSYNAITYNYGIQAAIDDGKFIDDFIPINSTISYAVYTPKYNRDTYLFWIVLAGVVVAAAATATVVASLKIRNTIIKQRAKNAASVEAAWQNLVDHPTSQQAADTYYRTARRANIWSLVFGGTSFNTSNYWDTGTEVFETSNGATNIPSSYLFGNYSNVSSDNANSGNLSSAIAALNFSTPAQVSDGFSDLRTLIAGPNT